MFTLPKSLLNLAIFVVALAASSKSFAADPLTFESQTPGLEIVLEIESLEQPGQLRGRFFERQDLVDHVLEGHWDGPRLVLNRPDADGVSVLTYEDGALVGTWRLLHGPARQVVLRRVDVRSRRPDVPRDLSLYDAIRLSGLDFDHAGPLIERTQGGSTRSTRSLEETKSGVGLVRLETGYPPEVMATLNEGLERLHWLEINRHFSCINDDSRVGSETGLSYFWTGDTFVSFVYTPTFACADADHRGSLSTGHTFDVSAGRWLVLEDLFYLGEGDPPAEGSESFAEYRTEVFAPAIAELTRTILPLLARPTLPVRLDPTDLGSVPTECDLADPGIWAFPVWTMNGEGLVLQASFSGLDHICGGEVRTIVPMDILQDLGRQSGG